MPNKLESDTQADLEKEHADVLERIKTLFQANQDLWEEMVRGGRSRAEALPQIAHNYDELIRLGQQEKVIVQQLLELEKRA